MRVISNSFFVGMDIGQACDPSAFAIVERVHTIHDERDPVTWARIETTEFRLRQVQRIALGTPYPAVVERAREIVASDALRANVELVVDSTGVGRAVLDLLRQVDLRGCKVQPVWITGGDKVQESARRAARAEARPGRGRRCRAAGRAAADCGPDPGFRGADSGAHEFSRADLGRRTRHVRRLEGRRA